MTLQIDDLATPYYRSQLRERYMRKGWGASGKSHAQTITDFANEIGATRILDYGCGRGTLKPALPVTFDVREFDPGIIGKDALPEPADLVVATDVLEHIEPACLDNVLAHIRDLAVKGIFLVIAMSPAKEILPDGRNAHLIIQQKNFWTGKLVRAGLLPSRVEKRKGLFVWIKK